MKYLALLLSALLFISCAKNYDKKLNEAEELINQGKFKESIELLKEVANANDKKLSPIALKKLAVIYQQNSVEGINYIESQKIAQKYFYQIFDKYPEYEEAPKSLFMSAYLLANELNQFDEATKQYNLFIEKYPNDELFESAKIELENIGLSPEEILKRRISKTDAN